MLSADKMTIGDVVLLEKWLLDETDTQSADWKAADLNADNRLSEADGYPFVIPLVRSQKR